MGDLSVLGLVLDFAGVDEGARKTIAALDKVEKKFDTTAKANDDFNKRLNTGTEVRNAAQSFKILEGALTNQLGSTREARGVLNEYTGALKQAAGGNKELQATFASLGVNVSRALENPKAGLAQMLLGFKGLSTEAEKASIAEKLFLSDSKAIIPALNSASDGLSAVKVAGGGAALSIAAVAGAAATGAIAIGSFTLSLARQATEITSTAQAMNVSVEAYQRYAIAAEIVGVQNESLNEALRAYQRNVGATGPTFDAFLEQLGNIPSASDRVALATATMGEVSQQAARAIVALTDNHGELMRQIQATGAVMSTHDAKDLAQLDRDYQLLKLDVEGIAKSFAVGLYRALGLVKEGMGLLAQEEVDLALYQQDLAKGTDTTTKAIENQTGAVNALGVALQNLNYAGIEAGVKERVTKIAQSVSGYADRALTREEARRILNARFKQDPDLKAGVEQDRIYQQNLKLFNELVDPPKPANASAARQAEQALRQMQEARARIIAAGNEYELRSARDNLEIQKEFLESAYQDGLVITRRYYDERLALAEESGQAELQALQARAGLIKSEQVNALLDSQQARRKGDLTEERTATARALQKEAELLSNLSEQEHVYNRLLAESIRNLREFKRALGTLSDVDLSKQEQPLGEYLTPLQVGARNKIFNLEKSLLNEFNQDLINNQFSRDRERIQTELARGTINEAQAKTQIVALEQKYSERLIKRLQIEKELAGWDQAKIAALDAEIERMRQLGTVLTARGSFLAGLRDGSQTASELYRELGQGIRASVREGLATGFREGFRSGMESLLLGLSDRFANFAIDSILGSLFNPRGGATGWGSFDAYTGGSRGGGWLSTAANWIIGGLFGGGRASGGNVTPGHWYMVGERGPEPFVPTVPGRIVPNNQMAMAGAGMAGQRVINQTIVFNIHTPNVEEFRRSQPQLAREAAKALNDAQRYF